jgi:thiaminase/transcriptional activator TenA
MDLAKPVWAENADLAQAALEHPFVQGLRTGTLPRQNFQSSSAQDAYFLDAFARASALALAHSPNQQGVRDCFDLLVGVLEELRLHESYAARWGVDLSTVTPTSATLAYTDFLLATAALQGVGETCAALTPCMRLYAFLGQALAADALDDEHPYVEWIRTYCTGYLGYPFQNQEVNSHAGNLNDTYLERRLQRKTLVELSVALFIWNGYAK